MRLFSLHPPSFLQAFIETMFASKAPVDEAFLYAKVSPGQGGDRGTTLSQTCQQPTVGPVCRGLCVPWAGVFGPLGLYQMIGKPTVLQVKTLAKQLR